MKHQFEGNFGVHNDISQTGKFLCFLVHGYNDIPLWTAEKTGLVRKEGNIYKSDINIIKILVHESGNFRKIYQTIFIRLGVYDGYTVEVTPSKILYCCNESWHFKSQNSKILTKPEALELYHGGSNSWNFVKNNRNLSLDILRNLIKIHRPIKKESMVR